MMVVIGSAQNRGTLTRQQHDDIVEKVISEIQK